MRVSFVATFLPPPHLARAGAQPERFAKEVSDGAISREIDAAVKHAIAVGLFDAGGCMDVVIQRASVGEACPGDRHRSRNRSVLRCGGWWRYRPSLDGSAVSSR
jgi:hypothetical protein